MHVGPERREELSYCGQHDLHNNSMIAPAYNACRKRMSEQLSFVKDKSSITTILKHRLNSTICQVQTKTANACYISHKYKCLHQAIMYIDSIPFHLIYSFLCEGVGISESYVMLVWC